MRKLLDEVAKDPKKITGEARQQLFMLMQRLDDRMRDSETPTTQLLQYAELLSKIGSVMPKDNPQVGNNRPTFSVVIQASAPTLLQGKAPESAKLVEVVQNPDVIENEGQADE